MKEVTVYTTTFCSYCVAAKRLLTEQKIPFKEVNLDGNDELRQKLSDENEGYRTVPMIFFGTTFIGGFDELRTLHRSGKLLETLNV